MPNQFRVLSVLTALLLLSSFCQLAACDEVCQQLNPIKICNLAKPGFKFNDGCNAVTCGDNGTYTATEMFCINIENNECRRLERVAYENLAQGLKCPKLTTAVCKTAPDGFRFTDGCSLYTCNGVGSGMKELLRECDSNLKLDNSQLEICNTLTGIVAAHLPRSTCNMNLTEICLSKGDRFAFTDGCNRIRCYKGRATSTRILCPLAHEDSFRCQVIKEKLAATPTPVAYTCSSLSVESICKRAKADFTYNDGCNWITCTSSDDGISSTAVTCPHDTDTDNDEQSRRFCADALVRVENELDRMHGGAAAGGRRHSD